MTDSVSFNVRACFAVAADRIYRVELCKGMLYFLRIGGQFDVERGIGSPGGAGKLAAVMLLAVREALLRKHKGEELVARDPTRNPEELLSIHPHNFKLSPSNVTRARLLPKKWFVSLFRRHYGRLEIQPLGGKRQEYHFETMADLKSAYDHLRDVLGERLEIHIRWDERKGRFVPGE